MELEKLFDDTIVQYWFPRSAVFRTDSKYRITVKPSGITIDKLCLSEGGFKVWSAILEDIPDLEAAAQIVWSIQGRNRIVKSDFVVREAESAYTLCSGVPKLDLLLVA